MDAQRVYWNSMVQWKFELMQFEELYRKSISLPRTLKIAVAIISSGAIATLAIWKEHPLIWALIAIAGQVVTVIIEQTPFRERTANLSTVCDELSKIYGEIEKKWFEVSEGELTAEEVYAKRCEFSVQWQNAQNTILTNDYIVLGNRKIKLLDCECNRYFEGLYGGQNENDTL